LEINLSLSEVAKKNAFNVKISCISRTFGKLEGNEKKYDDLIRSCCDQFFVLQHSGFVKYNQLASTTILSKATIEKLDQLNKAQFTVRKSSAV